jgi:hypothetical protein
LVQWWGHRLKVEPLNINPSWHIGIFLMELCSIIRDTSFRIPVPISAIGISFPFYKVLQLSSG